MYVYFQTWNKKELFLTSILQFRSYRKADPEFLKSEKIHWDLTGIHRRLQYKLLYIILNNIEIYEEPVLRTNKIPYCGVEFETGEENRIVHESLEWLFNWVFP